METQQQKNLLIGDTYRLLTYGIAEDSESSFQIDDILFDEERLERAVRMLYRTDTPIEESHIDRLAEQMEVDIREGNVSKEFGDYYLLKIEQLAYWALDDDVFEVKGLTAQLAKAIALENYELCEELEKKIKLLWGNIDES